MAAGKQRNGYKRRVVAVLLTLATAIAWTGSAASPAAAQGGISSEGLCLRPAVLGEWVPVNPSSTDVRSIKIKDGPAETCFDAGQSRDAQPVDQNGIKTQYEVDVDLGGLDGFYAENVRQRIDIPAGSTIDGVSGPRQYTRNWIHGVGDYGVTKVDWWMYASHGGEQLNLIYIATYDGGSAARFDVTLKRA